MIRIFIIEDNVLTSLGLKHLLQSKYPDYSLAGYAKDLNSAAVAINNKAPDVILLDLYLGRLDPILNFKSIKEQFSRIPVVILSSETTLPWKWRMMLEGASGYFEKGYNYEELISALNRVVAGEQVIPDELDAFIRYFHLPDGIQSFSAADLDLVRMRKEGKRMKEIAVHLGKSVHGVEKQCMKICQMLNLGNMDSVIKCFYGLDMGLLTFGGDFPH